MKYTKKQFFEEVAKEAEALKKNATGEEKSKLYFDRLYPDDYTQCIYGQITGDCTNERAKSLISKCCTRYIINNRDGAITATGFEAIKKNVNGKRAENSGRNGGNIHHFSSIEAYILMPKAKNKNLIDYIKGERKDLVL